jgi:hypothetical protein
MGWMQCSHKESREYDRERDSEETLLGALSTEYTTATVRRTIPKVGRNEPCPCGSGSKIQKMLCIPMSSESVAPPIWASSIDGDQS